MTNLLANSSLITNSEKRFLIIKGQFIFNLEKYLLICRILPYLLLVELFLDITIELSGLDSFLSTFTQQRTSLLGLCDLVILSGFHWLHKDFLW